LRVLQKLLDNDGRPITIIGEIVGDKIMPIDEIMYRYPLLDEKLI